MSKPDKGEMTIGELAERTGMTVRNIRAHQTRGLLPPPVVHGRTGYYNEEHVARIELTRELQADGLNLEAIRRMGESVNGAAEEIFDLTRSLRAPFEEEAPEIVELVELAELWKKEVEEGRGFEMLERGEKLGTIRSLPDGKVEVISPRMMSAAAGPGRRRHEPRCRPRRRREAAPQGRRDRPALHRPLLRAGLEALRRSRSPRRATGPRCARPSSAPAPSAPTS